MNPGPNLSEIGTLYLTQGGALIARPKSGGNLVIGSFCEVKRQVDGSYSIRPLQEWITVRDTCHILGCSEGTLARLLDAVFPAVFGPALAGKPLLASRRPSSGLLQVLRADVLRHCEQCKDPEFWSHFKGSAVGQKSACKAPDLFESAI